MAQRCLPESAIVIEVASPSQLAPAQGEITPGITSDAPVAGEVVSDAPSVEHAEVAEGVTSPQQLLRLMNRNIRRVLAKHGGVYIVMEGPNPYAVLLRSDKGKLAIRTLAHHNGVVLRSKDISEIIEYLHADAEMHSQTANVWQRFAAIPGGVEIDLGDDQQRRVRITAGKVEVVSEGSTALFVRSQTNRPMALPAESGNYKLLKRFLNIGDAQFVLLVAWITYVIAHPKVPATKYPILVIGGNQGSGKSWTNRVIKRVIDPSAIEVQTLPGNGRDLAIAAQSSHVLCYDNLRSITQPIADLLCIASTGGSVATRQLYTDAEQAILVLHVALVLNGIHDFVDQPDLAQRCLRINQVPLPEERRQSEDEMAMHFEAELPEILRGLFDLIASIYTYLPDVEVTNPERMIDFVKWLAAMEKVDGVPAGIYQGLYSENLQQGQLDSLMENHLAAVIVEFAENRIKGSWSGTPAKLLVELNLHVTIAAQRSRDWPRNPIALSKRLRSLQAGLRSQGIHVELSRGKHRTVTIEKIGGTDA